jgi:ubiquinol-cytochrome c reductase cytochrome b subunit
MAKYYAPKNFNFWYIFGVLSLLVLVNQLLTGIWLTMHYQPSAEQAFESVEYIMRDVPYGDVLRYLHSTGASAFFAVVYLHMFRGIMYGSYKKPRELLWIVGMFIYLMLMAEGFLGYVLPWGNMSYWGAQVIVNLFGAIPIVGEDLVQWIRGDFLISGATLNRFFALHVVALPLVLVMLVFVHILALHEVGSNNPDGVEIKKNKDANGIPKDGIPFFPYYLPMHDLVGVVVFLFVFCGIVFFVPEMYGYFLEHANFEPANNLKTPEHIAPVWYFTPFYTMLRVVTIDLGPLTSKFLGFVVMIAAIAIMFVLPWLDRGNAKSVRYKGWMPRLMLMGLAAIFIVLGYLGVQAPNPGRNLLGQVATLFYFVYFIGMPVYSNPNVKTGIVGWGVCGLLGIDMVFIALFTGLPADETLGYFQKLAASEVPGLIRVFCTLLGIFVVLIPWLTDRDGEKPEPERVQMKGLPKILVLGGLLLVVALVLVPISAVAAESSYDCGSIHCDEFQPAFDDKASLQNGAKWYDSYCFGCHSLKFSRYERVADDLEVPHEVMVDVMVPDGKKIGDLMEISMDSTKAKAWLAATPPDLSVVTRARGTDWLYTYLRNFYKDDSRPVGVNNKVFESVAMPHVMMELQGLPECAKGTVVDDHGNATVQDCGKLVPGAIQGSMSPEDFDKVVYDLVNYLHYVAEPGADRRKHIGIYVMLFLGVFLVFAYLLDREYWKDIH